MLTKVSEVRELVQKGRVKPESVFKNVYAMATGKDWKKREVAATVLVEISKKKPNEVITEMSKWAVLNDPNARRTASEGLREIARQKPADILPVIEKLNKDTNIYVKKSVANILRNATRRDQEFVLSLCRRWAAIKDPNTNWIIQNGLIKARQSSPSEVHKIINSLSQ